MVGEANRTLAAADTPTVVEGRNDSGAERDAPVTSSSSVTLAIVKMVNNIVPEMSDYWKKINNHRSRSPSLS
jgi:hypothetical protein